MNLFPHPAHSLPVPELKFDFRMSVTHGPYVRLGTTSAEIKNWIPINGGTWSGTFGSGTVVVGFADYLFLCHISSLREVAERRVKEWERG